MSERAKSRYAQKKDGGNQMYGPGCCGHKLTQKQVEDVKAKVREQRHWSWTPGKEVEAAKAEARAFKEQQAQKQMALPQRAASSHGGRYPTDAESRAIGMAPRSHAAKRTAYRRYRS